MRRLAYLFAAVVMAAILAGSSADAQRDVEWCAEDPVFTVLGAEFRITTFVNSPASAVTRIVYDVEVPKNAGAVGVKIPATEALAAVTTVRVHKTGPSYDAGDGSFRVRVSVTVSGPDHAKVVAQLDGASVKAKEFNGHTQRALNFHFDVTP